MKRVLLLLFITILLIAFSLTLLLHKNTNKEEIPLETKIGQMIVTGYSENEKVINRIRSDIENNRISGFIFYKYGIESPKQIRKKIDKLNSMPSTYPLFIIVDQEGGLVSRIADDNGFKTYPSAESIAKNHTPEEAYKIYSDMAKDLHKAGFNFNLAPCVDMKTNPGSVIGKRMRTYGSDSETVTKYSKEFIRAHNKSNVITALKHFPGMGNAVLDSHKALPDITNSWNEKEFEPFKNIIQEFPDEPVMVGHVINKKFDADNISSGSGKTINLLKDMNHAGLVITDAIDMDAVNNRNIEDIIVDSINAGVNLFIFPNHDYYPDDPKKYMCPEMFINIVLNAVKEGKIDKDKIDTSFTKIMKLKQNIRKSLYE